jgi:EAL domain-containing protein (putative c-di-GMP-specific phosphodiesterase class I)
MASDTSACNLCRSRGKARFPLAIRMAYQPIVDIASGRVFAHEALVRGENGEGAGYVLSQITDENRYGFDQTCRVQAIETASRIGVPTAISINFMPNAVYEPANCIRTTLRTAEKTGTSLDRIIFEFTENEDMTDHAALNAIVEEYNRHGLRTAIDDFGAGYSGLNKLARLQPDYVKLDMDLTRDLDRDRRRQAIVRQTTRLCEELGVAVIAEGIETVGEMTACRDAGINLIQGYLFSKPRLEDFYRDSEILKAFLPAERQTAAAPGTGTDAALKATG